MTKKRYKNRRESFYAAFELRCSDRIVFDLKIFSNIPTLLKCLILDHFRRPLPCFRSLFFSFLGEKAQSAVRTGGLIASFRSSYYAEPGSLWYGSRRHFTLSISPSLPTSWHQRSDEETRCYDVCAGGGN